MGGIAMRTPVPGKCGMDNSARAERLALLGLDNAACERSGAYLQASVIGPNVDQIVDLFYAWLAPVDEFQQVAGKTASLDKLKVTMTQYLLGLGVDYGACEYFDDRFHVGRVHQRLGVSHSLYQCAFRHLQQLLISVVPAELQQDPDAYNDVIHFIIKITALDMSLATESYCDASLTGLQHSLEDERDKTERLRKLSYTDSLTELYNHAYSRHCLDLALQRATGGQRPLCVLMADLDHFKTINDTHGHLVGDMVLQITAARMLAALRGGDQLGRYGGEEFLFILEDATAPDGLEVAERVRHHICRDAISCGKTPVRVTLSIGLAEAREGDTVNSLIERADAALYAAKAAGRNCIRAEDKC